MKPIIKKTERKYKWARVRGVVLYRDDLELLGRLLATEQSTTTIKSDSHHFDNIEDLIANCPNRLSYLSISTGNYPSEITLNVKRRSATVQTSDANDPSAAHSFDALKEFLLQRRRWYYLRVGPENVPWEGALLGVLITMAFTDLRSGNYADLRRHLLYGLGWLIVVCIYDGIPLSLFGIASVIPQRERPGNSWIVPLWTCIVGSIVAGLIIAAILRQR